MNSRLMWLPKLKELPKQCVSCPFIEGNDTEFGAVLTKLRAALMPSNKSPITQSDIRFARLQVKLDCTHSGDFICHRTAYTPDMDLRPESDRRQCPGATQFFRWRNHNRTIKKGAA